MKKRIGIILVILLLEITGCSSTVKISNSRIKTDVLAYDLIKNSIKDIVSFKIDSINETENRILVNISMDFTTSEAEAEVDVKLTYANDDKKWVLTKSELTIISIKTEILPDDDKVFKGAIPGGFKDEHEEFEFNDIGFVSKTKDPSSLKTTYLYEAKGGVLSWTHRRVWTIEANYTLDKGYTYTLVNDIYTESTDWNGKWTMCYGTQTDYVRIPVTISGESGLTQIGNKEPTWINTMTAQFTYEGLEYALPVIYGYPNQTGILTSTRGIGVEFKDKFMGLGIIFGYGLKTDAFYYCTNIEGPIGQIEPLSK